MKNPEAIAVALRVGIALLGLSWLVFWLYRGYRVDQFRQEMFGLRDDLFRRAAEGMIGFNHPAYGLLRGTMNGFIRFGHQLNIAQLLSMAFLIRGSEFKKDVFAETWNARMRGLDEQTVAEMDAFRQRMNVLFIKFVLLGSPALLLTVILPIIFWFLLEYCIALTLRFFGDSLDEIDFAAMEQGLPADAAIAAG